MSVSECERASAAIEEFGDGELGRAKWLLLRRHARRCSRCGSYLGRMKIVVRALDGMNHLEAPGDLEETVLTCLERACAPGAVSIFSTEGVHDHRNLFLVAGAAGLGLAAVALAVVRWALYRGRDESLAPIAPA